MALTILTVLWLIHTAWEREWERERDEEWWTSILFYVLYTLHRDREWDRDQEWGPMGFIPISTFPFPVPLPLLVPCYVNKALALRNTMSLTLLTVLHPNEKVCKAQVYVTGK